MYIENLICMSKKHKKPNGGKNHEENSFAGRNLFPG